MRTRLFGMRFVVIVLTAALALVVALIHWNTLQAILALPFLLFCPGYSLLSILNFKRDDLIAMEKLSLSIVASIAVVSLTGLILNYTPWGINPVPVLVVVGIFNVTLSTVSLLRPVALPEFIELKFQTKFRFPLDGTSKPNKAIAIGLSLCILVALGVLLSFVIDPVKGEVFTEFYALGLNAKPQDYPTGFTIEKGQVTQVTYGSIAVQESAARINLGIVNHEKRMVSYSISVIVDGQEVPISTDGQKMSQLDNIIIGSGEKWGQQIEFVPQHEGDNQEVEFVLYKDGIISANNSLHLWINVDSPT